MSSQTLQRAAPLLLGELFSMYMFGLLTVQVYIYYLTFPNDTKFIKGFVYSVFLVELAAIAMSISDTYHWFASGFGNVVSLNDVQLSPVDTAMMSAFVAAAVQMFYCYRIYMINKKAWWVSVIVALLALVQTGAGIYTAIFAQGAGKISNAEEKISGSVTLLLVSTAAADIVIAGTMITLLLRSRKNHEASRHTNFIIMKIINVVVETNMASASIAIVTVVLFLTIHGTDYFPFNILLGRIYSNSLLLILNNRHYLETNAESGGSQWSTQSIP